MKFLSPLSNSSYLHLGSNRAKELRYEDVKLVCSLCNTEPFMSYIANGAHNVDEDLLKHDDGPMMRSSVCVNEMIIKVRSVY